MRIKNVQNNLIENGIFQSKSQMMLDLLVSSATINLLLIQKFKRMSVKIDSNT